MEELRKVLRSISDERAAEMREVAAKYPFRIPRYYVENVLRDDPADPLWELALPGKAEIYDAGAERWDAFQLVGKAAEHSRWIQKYRYEVLLRLTNFCSGLCRYCYLKNRENIEGFITHAEINDMFDQADRSSNKFELREIVLSGGDPLTVPGEYLEHLADRIDRLNASLARRITVTVHTREPVWYPNRVSRTKGLLKGLQRLQPSSYILHVVHPRKVTRRIARCNGDADGPCRETKTTDDASTPAFSWHQQRCAGHHGNVRPHGFGRCRGEALLFDSPVS